MTILGDIHYLETTNADGTINQLFLSGDWSLLSRGNYGSPPISWLTESHYQGHGERVLDYRIGARAIGLNIVHNGRGTRADYWDNRATLLDFMRPNYASPTKLVISNSSGELRAIDVRPDPGAPFEPTDDASFVINQTIQVVAHNPFWYNPNISQPTISSTVDVNLAYPITFPISFGSSGTVFSTGDLNYQGTWRAYPKITITGGFSQATITNTGTNIELILINNIGDGDQRIIEFNPDIGRSIVDASGVNKLSDLSVNSNMVDFYIAPSSEITTTQKINVTLTGITGSSNVSIQYYTRYYGI